MKTKIMKASKVGFPCDRNLWYSVNGHEAKVSAASQRIFDVGKALEPIVIDWLNQDGWITFYNANSQDAALELYEPIRGGMIGGHPDVMMSRGDLISVLADIKTMNERHFLNWKRNGTLKEFPQYADQLHCYAYAAKQAKIPVEHLAVVGVNKNNSKMHIDVFDYDEQRMMNIIERSERIFKLDTPPKRGDRTTSWACQYCEYSHICELCKESQVKDTHVGNDVVKTTNPDIIKAAETLKEARELSKCAKELEDDAKSVLDEKVRKKGIKSVNIGNFILVLNETSSSRFDSTAFKKAHPEMVKDFMKISNSVTYNIKEVA